MMTGCVTSHKPSDRESLNVATARINAELGLTYLSMHDTKRARLKLLEALKLAPDSPEPWYSTAYFLELTGEPASAEKYFLKAISLSPERGDSHNNYGTFLCRQGKYAKAIEQFELA